MAANPTDNSGAIVACSISESFAEWLASAGGTLAISTYQAGKVALVGWNGQQVSLLLRDFPKPMGMAVRDRQMALATHHEVLLLADAPLLAPELFEQQPGRYDALYLPRVAYQTGDLHVHDVGFGDDGLWLVNTRFCCLSAPSDEFSFAPRWKPPFVSEIVPEDRCHLNGLAIVDGQPRYVTCLGTTDTPGGWRADKATGGVIVSVPDGQIVARGLAMPHSPRWHDGKLWVLNSGEGQLVRVDPAPGTLEVVCTLPGYLRGLCFVGPYAVVGMCQIREEHIFGGLPIGQRFERLLCGVAVVDLRTGGTVGTFEFTSGCHELFEVQFLPGVRQGMILNSRHPAAREAFAAPEFSYWLRPSNEIPLDGSESRDP
ncbi:MAG: TIGR03032 family protein [Planctomycetota bacterium]|nr:MAG: TIGR03032 family protein [Planctomycetota bacterium]